MPVDQNKYPGQTGTSEKVEIVGAGAGGLVLPGAMEVNGFVDDIDRRVQKRIDLLHGVQAAAEPYRDAVIGELVARAPQHRKRIASPPPYAKDPGAWRKYVDKHAQTVDWKRQAGGASHSLSLRYLPERDGNKLVGFTSDTRERAVSPGDGRGDDSFVHAELSFDRGELVEAGMSQYKFSQLIGGETPRPVRGISITVGTEPAITYPDTNDTVFVYNEALDDGAFIATAGRGSPTSRSEYMQRLDEVLAAVPTLDLKPTEV